MPNPESKRLRPESEKRTKSEVRFFFSAHGLPEDYRGIEEAFQESDIYVPEAHGWKPKHLEHFRALAHGDKIPKHIQEHRAPKDALEYEEGLLYQSGKQVEIIDLPDGHELAHEDDGASGFSEAAEIFIAQGNVPHALESIEEAAKMNANYIKRKDAFIGQQLKTLLDELAKDGKQHKLLIQMGATHTGISHDTSKEIELGRIKNDVRFNFTDELVRTYRFDKQPTKELVMKALVERLIERYFADEIYQLPYLTRNTLLRDVLNNLTEAQLQRLGQLMEENYFNRVVMNEERDSEELNKEIFAQAWSTVMGSDLASIIFDTAQKTKQ